MKETIENSFVVHVMMYYGGGERVVEVSKVGEAGTEKVQSSKITVGLCAKGAGWFCPGMTCNEGGESRA